MDFSFPNILRIITNDIGMTLPRLADGLNRERSLVNKWMTGKYKPRPEYIPLIVETILKNATVSQLIIVTAHLVEFIHASQLPIDLKDSLLSKTSGCAEFLFEIMTVSLSVIPVPDVAIVTASLIESPVPDAAPITTLKVRLSRHLTVPVCAVLSAFMGGALWTLVNQVLGWTFYAGSPGGEPYAFTAFVWGFLAFLPHAIIYLIFLTKKFDVKLIATLAVYIIVGSLSATLFYTSGIRVGIESYGFSYELREIIIVIIYSFIISFPPYIALRILNRTAAGTKKTALRIVLPIAAALLAVVLSLFIRRPEIEVAGIRGLLVGMFMRTCIFYVMAGHQKGTVPLC